jgi:hypothetical protein
MTGRESELNYVTLSNCQQIGEMLEKVFFNSLGICSKFHREAIIISINCYLPQINELGHPKRDEKLQAELEEAMQSRELVVKIPLRVTSAMMDDHLIKPAKGQILIHSFLDILKMDMKILSRNSVAHKVTLDPLVYRRIISISNYHEVWETYIRDKDKVES